MLEDEIPQVDVWTWQDKMIQPRQEAELKTLLKKAFISYFNIENNQFIHLQDKKIDVLMFDQNRKQTYILAFDNIIYSLESSWDRPKRRDCYIINTKTGEKRLAVKNTSARFRLTPDGNFALYFDRDQKHWFSLSLMDAKKTNLTKDLKVAFQDEEYDRPSIATTYGFGGFDNVGNALVYDKYDIWKLSVNGLGKPINITKRGKRKNVTYRTLQLDNENKDLASYKRDKLLITSFNNQTKVSGLYVFFNDKLIEKIAPSNYYISNFIKSKEGAVLTYTKENFNTFPDIHYLKDEVNLKITSINPQQKEFRWGTAELYHWKAFDGTKLEGLLYKPKHFYPSKKYPLITYFYEKLSDDLCKYKIPKPSASTVNPSYLVSNDYILFVPNIVYGIGRSGEDAFNCIISGVEKLEKTGFIDSNKMALQGQSWGGYQTAYLITVTTKFKAAMAGAPVSNMTSAYGGVRWKTGQSRAWQYEKD